MATVASSIASSPSIIFSSSNCDGNIDETLALIAALASANLGASDCSNSWTSDGARCVNAWYLCAPAKRKREARRTRPVVASDLPMMMISPSRVVARVGVVSFLSFEEEEEEEDMNASTLNETLDEIRKSNSENNVIKRRRQRTTFRRGKG